MFSKQHASQSRRNFWTSFGQYMRPLRGAGEQTVNWLNYKTGVRHLYFRMDANNKQADISIELRHPDPSAQQQYFEQFLQLQKFFHDTMGEDWDWQMHKTDEDGKPVSRISKTLDNVNIFNSGDWPEIISFLKQRMLALDNFWTMVKDGFE